MVRESAGEGVVNSRASAEGACLCTLITLVSSLLHSPDSLDTDIGNFNHSDVSTRMENGEKKAHEASSELPEYDRRQSEAIDMRGQRQSIVKNEAAELYGDIHTVERECSPYKHQSERRFQAANSPQNMAMSLAVSSPVTSSSLLSAARSALACSWVSALPLCSQDQSPCSSATHSQVWPSSR